jgi:hypothetical protein
LFQKKNQRWKTSPGKQSPCFLPEPQKQVPCCANFTGKSLGENIFIDKVNFSQHTPPNFKPGRKSQKSSGIPAHRLCSRLNADAVKAIPEANKRGSPLLPFFDQRSEVVRLRGSSGPPCLNPPKIRVSFLRAS